MSGIYDDEHPGMKPGDSFVVTKDTHVFKITATNESGIHSGRTRYCVQCLSCAVMVHRGSTSSRAQMDYHLRNPTWGTPSAT